MPIYACGFEAGNEAYYTAMGWSFNGGTAGIYQNGVSGLQHKSFAGFGGEYSMKIEDGAVSPNFGPTSTVRWLHFWIQYQSEGAWANGFLLHLREGTTVQATLSSDGRGGIEIRRGTATTLASSATPFKYTTPNWFAIELDAANSGSFSVWVNGVLMVTFSGDTQAGASPGWDNILIFGANLNLFFDDFIVTSAEEGRLEEAFIYGVLPDGDDAVALTPSVGVNNFANVDEIPPSTVEYNEATAALQEDFYDMAALPDTPGRVISLSVSAYVARDGTITQAEQGVKSGATTDRKAPETLGAAAVYEIIQQNWATDPNTSTAIAAVNQTTDFFGIAGDVSAIVAVGSFIEVSGSTGNDGLWVVESVVFNSPNTEITITGEIPDATVDGNLTYNWTETTVNAAKTGIRFS